MKKSTRIVTVITLALCISFLVIGSVSAIFIGSPSREWNDPYAVPAKEGVMFNSEVAGEGMLPGTVIVTGNKYEPVGFPVHQAQFGGKGLIVSKLPEGQSVTVCFDFPLYVFDWAGKIYQWTGTEWMGFPTKITQAPESANALACASGLKNGTYALIIGFWGTPEPPMLRVFN